MKKLIFLIIISIFSSNFLIANECLNKCEQEYKNCQKAVRKSRWGWGGISCEQILEGCKTKCFFSK